MDHGDNTPCVEGRRAAPRVTIASVGALRPGGDRRPGRGRTPSSLASDDTWSIDFTVDEAHDAISRERLLRHGTAERRAEG